MTPALRPPTPPAVMHPASTTPPPVLTPISDDGRVGPGAVLLALLGLALGISLSWGWRNSRLCSDLTAQATQLRVDAALLAAQQRDLAELLIASDAKRVRLESADLLRSSGARAIVLWSQDNGAGALIAENLWPLEHEKRYHLWTQLPQAQSPQLLGTLQADNGVTFWRFRLTDDNLGAPRRFLLTIQQTDSSSPPEQVLLVGQAS